MKNNITIKFLLCAFLLAAFAIATIAFSRPAPSEASTFTFSVPKVATSSQAAISNSAVLIAATTTNCIDRVISTNGTAIQLSFTGALLPSGQIGHGQAASTTIAYNNGDYGCGAIYGFASPATNVTITVLTDNQ